MTAARRTITSTLCAMALVATSIAVAPSGGAATPSPDLAFRAERDGNAEIYTSGQGGGGQTDISNSNAEDLDPAFAPDGSWIAFARHSSPLGGTHIFLIRPGGCCAKRLTSVPTIDRQPDFSPDGTKLAFTRGEEDFGSFQIWVMGADGSNLHPVTGATQHVFNGSPDWSPDGTRIAFVSDRGGGFPKIFLMNADGTFPHQLSSGTWADGNPAWSPDGTLIAFDRCCPDGHSSIFLMPATGNSVIRVTGDGIEAQNPTWSPDGTTLAFVGYPPGGGNRDIYTIHVDGSGLTRVTNDPWSDLSPAWNPTQPAQASATDFAPPSTPLRPSAGDTAQAVETDVTGRASKMLAAQTAPRAAAAHHRKKRPKKKLPPITRKTTRLAPGLTLTRIVNRKIPLRVFALRAHILTTKLTEDVALATNVLPGFETVQSMATRHRAIAAVNGDFGLSSGRPMNIYAEDGDLKQTMFGWGNNVSISDDESREFLGHPVEDVTAQIASTGETFDVQRVNEGTEPVFGEITEYTGAGGSTFKPQPNSCGARLAPSAPRHFDASGSTIVRDFEVKLAGCFAEPIARDGGVVLSAYPGDDQSLFVRALVPGEHVTLRWTLGWHRTLDTIGGFPRLLRDGDVVAKDCPLRFCDRNPRTSVGFTDDGTMLLVVVDGRQPKYSKGLSLVGMAHLMRRFGAVDALNLDGGGSSTMVVRGKVINRPSDPGGPRHVSSAVLILNGPDPGDAPYAGTGGTSILGGGPAQRDADREAWRLAARDPGSIGGLAQALALRGLRPLGFRMTPALARVLRIYRGG